MTSWVSFFSKKLQFIKCIYMDNIWGEDTKKSHQMGSLFLSEWGSLWNIVLYNKAKQLSQTAMVVLSEILITDRNF